ncbi:MAG: 30S ribosome-binding factor RbfA [Oscillibacter sp.]|nr:30S ribosome-binding factor RbfA [Oscillibacter sp.]
MAGNRIGRINEEMQRELSALIRRLKDPRVNTAGMVSVTRVEAAPDLRYATVYVSVLDKGREKDVLKGLKSAAGFLRREIGGALRLRYTPELRFVGDNSILRGAQVLEILRRVEQSDAERENASAESNADGAESASESAGGGAGEGKTC